MQQIASFLGGCLLVALLYMQFDTWAMTTQSHEWMRQINEAILESGEYDR